MNNQNGNMNRDNRDMNRRNGQDMNQGQDNMQKAPAPQQQRKGY